MIGSEHKLLQEGLCSETLDCLSNKFNLKPVRRRESLMMFGKISDKTESCIIKAPPRLDEAVKDLDTGPQPTNHRGVVRFSTKAAGMGVLALHTPGAASWPCAEILGIVTYGQKTTCKIRTTWIAVPGSTTYPRRPPPPWLCCMLGFVVSEWICVGVGTQFCGYVAPIPASLVWSAGSVRAIS